MKQEVRNVGKQSASTPFSGSNHLLYSNVESIKPEDGVDAENLPTFLTSFFICPYLFKPNIIQLSIIRIMITRFMIKTMPRTLSRRTYQENSTNLVTKKEAVKVAVANMTHNRARNPHFLRQTVTIKHCLRQARHGHHHVCTVRVLAGVRGLDGVPAVVPRLPQPFPFRVLCGPTEVFSSVSYTQLFC